MRTYKIDSLTEKEKADILIYLIEHKDCIVVHKGQAYTLQSRKREETSPMFIDEADAAFGVDRRAKRIARSYNPIFIGGSPTEYVQPASALLLRPERAGIVKFNENNRFEIQCVSGWTDELTCGICVSILIEGQWIDTSVEYSDSKNSYCLTTPGLMLEEGITAILTKYKEKL